MILRKPYAFLIKYFKIIHIVMFLVFGYFVFAINDIKYGIACTTIPKDEELFPTIILYEQGLSVEKVQ